MNLTRVNFKGDFQKILDLRKTVLHPDGPWERVKYLADSSEKSLHLAIFDDSSEVLACGTLLMEDESERYSESIARIRGMAVNERAQGKGLGAMILDALIEESKSRGVEKIWCNARTKILDFYLKRGFVSVGNEFVTAGGVPHYKLVKTITYKDALK